MTKRASPIGPKKLSTQKMLHLILQEIADVYHNLHGDIQALDQKLTTRIDGLERKFDGLEGRFDGLERRFDGLEQRFDGLERKFDALHLKVDRNHVAFITNQRDLDRRVTVLEEAR